MPTPASVGGPLGGIDFVFRRNRAVVKNRCEPVEVRFRIFGVVATAALKGLALKGSQIFLRLAGRRAKNVCEYSPLL